MADSPSTWNPIEDGSQLKDIRLRLLLAHWSEEAKKGRLPSKDIIDPAKVGDLMGWLFLYLVERDFIFHKTEGIVEQISNLQCRQRLVSSENQRFNMWYEVSYFHKS